MRTKGTYVMAPMIDSVNHVSSLGTEVEFDSLRQRFKLKVQRAFNRGDQVRHMAVISCRGAFSI